jgi:hypothetical protein
MHSGSPARIGCRYSTIWEYRVFGIAGHPKRYPFPSWEVAQDYWFPAIHLDDPLALGKRKAEVAAQQTVYLVFDGDFHI